MNVCLLVGAGFSFEANKYMDVKDRPYAKPYPLVGELAAECFDSSYDLSRGVEASFQEAIDRRDSAPIRALAERIQTADHYVGNRVAQLADSEYVRVLSTFECPTVISFNYDCLLELMLHKGRMWTPVDGFGVTCQAEVDRRYQSADSPPTTSQIQVVHLHGSLYLYPLEFENYRDPGDRIDIIRATADEVSRFDPDVLGMSFIPFQSGAQGQNYMHVDQRIIVPTPNKATSLKDRFVKAAYSSATESVSRATVVLSIGYSFADCDRASYAPLLDSLVGGGGRLVVVDPSADEIVSRLESAWAGLPISAIPLTLGKWADSGLDLPT